MRNGYVARDFLNKLINYVAMCHSSVLKIGLHSA